jgi:hypothetical protein
MGCSRCWHRLPQYLGEVIAQAPIDASNPSSAQRRRPNSVFGSAAESTRAGAAVSTTRAVIVSPP